MIVFAFCKHSAYSKHAENLLCLLASFMYKMLDVIFPGISMLLTVSPIKYYVRQRSHKADLLGE
jgi:hypothetical protein